ncbi:antibiotic biosynthesis monooxygenase [Nocardioides marmoriginsengisoli]|uniref:Antibiotic biosynthesis monooxygenase n=1 Tax=Nocardioides marmoriginsengisoli TaxID=661483 RepID=A0A3N0CNI7_9ACTN|nr:antibiotic biosynthesis monooxygenase family protein [Nocardioides marmoriginsengisoli]RNL64909.1 antibiotic biosynthesis monooxygenase [Nocardioides marmoriginsengisoli]
MIIVAGHLRVAEGERDQYLEAVAEVTAQARQAPGCHDFVQSADPLDPERIVIYERWESDEALLAFRTSGSEEPGSPAVPDVLDADVSKYRISAVESP